MYCPEGYTTVAELWERYHEERIISFYQSATKSYHSKDFKVSFVRGSPLDICEHVFLKSITIVGVNVASLDGRVFKLHSPLRDGYNGLFSVLPPGSSAENASYSFEHYDSDEEVRQLAGYRFRAWDDDKIRASWWRTKYPLLSAKDLIEPRDVYERLSYQCLPTCFERGNFTVVEKLPLWGAFFGRIADFEAIVGKFAGWSLCVSDKSLEDWWPYLDGKDVYPPNISENTVAGQVGRPSKIESARADFDALFPNGRTLPVKETLNRIEKATGNRYSESTLRRALKDRDSKIN